MGRRQRTSRDRRYLLSLSLRKLSSCTHAATESRAESPELKERTCTGEDSTGWRLGLSMPTLRVHGKTKTGFVSPSRLGWHVMTPPGVAPERRQAQEGGTLPPPRSAQKKIEATLRRSCGLGGGWACVGYIYIHIHIYMCIHIYVYCIYMYLKEGFDILF